MPRTIVAKPETWSKPKGISLEPTFWEKVDKAAARANKSRSEFVGEALAFYLSALAHSGIPGQMTVNSRMRESGQSTADEPEGWESSPLPD